MILLKDAGFEDSLTHNGYRLSTCQYWVIASLVEDERDRGNELFGSLLFLTDQGHSTPEWMDEVMLFKRLGEAKQYWLSMVPEELLKFWSPVWFPDVIQIGRWQVGEVDRMPNLRATGGQLLRRHIGMNPRIAG